MNTLQTLIGCIISKVEKIHDYTQLVFLGGAILNIFNDYVYDGGLIQNIEGKEIKSIDESSSTVTFVFESGESLSVGLSDNDYNGPEAMELWLDSKSPIVWN